MPCRFSGTTQTSAAWLLLLCTTHAATATAPICDDGAAPSPTMFVPRSAPAEMILDVSWFVWGICSLIFVIMASLMLWCIIKYRRAAGDDKEAPQIYGSNPIELAWTVVPTVIVFILFLVSARTIFEIQKTSLSWKAVRVSRSPALSIS